MVGIDAIEKAPHGCAAIGGRIRRGDSWRGSGGQSCFLARRVGYGQCLGQGADHLSGKGRCQALKILQCVQNRQTTAALLAGNTDQHFMPVFGNIKGDQQGRRDRVNNGHNLQTALLPDVLWAK